MRAIVTALSARQSEVAELVAKGLTSKEICGQLGIALGTVETHVRRIYRKTGVNSRTLLTAWVIDRGGGRAETRML
jgi:DNA-binding NarL/FixJ family response regulator